ncbi:RICIN domain-containing protein [Streptomyces sp. TS71-3]|uniref:RICIN domain-containing protein n=1 Tax=Streptomyces sp. TS71-3 TaxID=2733862 RepID=UPI001B0FDB9C|nr:hypothetical protein [Streptomyces sp. TS71-3]GHJ40050.1 hypothetical protein Sm713_56590 [Streptomyces sp. TS71-3]
MAEPDGVERDSTTGRDGPWTDPDGSQAGGDRFAPDPERADRSSTGRDAALRAARWGAAAAVLAALVTGIFSLWAARIDGGGNSDPAGAGSPSSVSPAPTSDPTGLPSPGSPTGDKDAPGVPLNMPVHIHPAGVANLCLTEGHTREHGKYSYDGAVAVQAPCDGKALPKVTVEPAGDRAYQIIWEKAGQGTGCLDVIEGDQAHPKANGLLQPVEACDSATRFTVETVKPPGPDRRYRFVAADGGQCLGIEDVASTGAEASLQDCSSEPAEPGQTFTVDAA